LTILSLLRAAFALLSLLILGAAGYLLWEWYQGDLVRDADGVLRLHRHAWQLWAGIALLAWSFLGRFVIRLVLARPDKEVLQGKRGAGRTIKSETGAEIYLEEYGSVAAQPLILTHGWSMDSTLWDYTKRALSQDFRVIVWDLPGLGLSKRDGKEISLTSFARDLRSVMAQVGDQRPILVGHSIGGMVIETLARDDPEAFKRRVAGVALFNTTYTNPLKTMILSRLLQALRKPLIVPMLYLEIWLAPLVWLSAWQSYLSGSTHLSARFGFGRFVTRSQLDHVALLMTRAWPAVTARGDLAMLRWDGSPGLARMTAPTLIVGGSLDIVTKADASKTIAQRIAHPVLRIIDGANHMGPIERADVYNGLLRSFAKQIGAGDAKLVPGPA
jgi:pimeloyl-ACP methyl ester carboxylesterase